MGRTLRRVRSARPTSFEWSSRFGWFERPERRLRSAATDAEEDAARAVLGPRSMLALLAFSLVLPSAGLAESLSSKWYWTPPPAELNISFEEQNRQHECSELERNPSGAQVECWARYLNRETSRVYGAQKDSRTPLACFENGWVVRSAAQIELESPGASASCGGKGDRARCVRPALGKGPVFGLFGGDEYPPSIPIQATIDRVSEDTDAMVHEYTAFQYLRRGHSRNRHTRKIAALAMTHGMLVLYRAQKVLEIERRLLAPSDGGEGATGAVSPAAGRCGVSFLLPYFARAREVVEEIGGADIPAILDSYPPPNAPWSRRLFEVQLALLGSPSGPPPTGSWTAQCDEVAGAAGDLDGRDADLNAWCGYGFWSQGDLGRATRHWQAARKSASHPDAASYANFAIRRARPGVGLR